MGLGRWGQRWMRTATFIVVLAIHAVFFFLFAVHRSPARLLMSESEPPATLMLLREVKPVETAAKPAAKPPMAARAARRAAPEAPQAISSAPKPESDSSAMTSTPAPDWRAEARIAANDAIEAEARKREHPSLLAPHDFSRAKAGSTDYSKPKFGWSHAHTHRVEGSPGAFVVNVNDRCAIALVLIFPFPLCKIGKMAPRGDLFDSLHDLPQPGEPNLP
ncbi:MAG: hypothetical protein QOI59_4043 [Gammaproteobacteria bacterium]|nr:hypothetical protein [Gammaproteobacteria bacterium]